MLDAFMLYACCLLLPAARCLFCFLPGPASIGPSIGLNYDRLILDSETKRETVPNLPTVTLCIDRYWYRYLLIRTDTDTVLNQIASSAITPLSLALGFIIYHLRSACKNYAGFDYNWHWYWHGRWHWYWHWHWHWHENRCGWAATATATSIQPNSPILILISYLSSSLSSSPSPTYIQLPKSLLRLPLSP